MNDITRANFELFVENYEIIKDTFKMESSYYYPVAAMFFTSKKEKASKEKLKNAAQLINKNTGVFSYIRSDMKLITAAHISLSEEPLAALETLKNAYDMLKEEFSGSSYLVNAALFAAQHSQSDKLRSIPQRARNLYNMMRQEHPFLTDQQDSGSAVLLAFSPFDDHTIIDRCEKCYSILRDEKVMHDPAQSLSQVLAMAEGDCEELARRTLRLAALFKESKRKYGTSFELPSLGLLAQLPETESEIIESVIAIDDILKEQRGFGNFFGIGQSQRLMYSAMLHCLEFESSFDEHNAAALNTAISMHIAQQSATSAAIAATAAASASN